MRKKVLLGILVVVVLFLGAASYYLLVYTRKASPIETVVYEKDGLKMEIVYCKPSKKGRLIFGEKAESALVPYGDVWRTGANAATVITLNKDITLNGEALKAGSYQLFTIPTATDWTVIINSETEQWGAFSYKPESDVIKTTVGSQKGGEVVEMFKIDFVSTDSTSAISLAWDDTKVLVPFK